MLQRALVAAIAVVLLIVGAAIPALAVTTQGWEERRIATEAYASAVAEADEAELASQAAVDALNGAMADAATSLTAAETIATKAGGFFDAALIAAVAPLAAALKQSLPAGEAAAERAPRGERPHETLALAAAAVPLAEWAATTRDAAREQLALAEVLKQGSASVADAVDAIGASVQKEATSALAAAPIASVETRKAVENARDAITSGDPEQSLIAALEAYIAKVVELRASQTAAQAAADAAAAAEAEQQPGSSGRTNPFGATPYERAYFGCHLPFTPILGIPESSRFPCTFHDSESGEIIVIYE